MGEYKTVSKHWDAKVQEQGSEHFDAIVSVSNTYVPLIFGLVFKFITCVASEIEAQGSTPSGLRLGCKWKPARIPFCIELFAKW